jgi:integrase
MRDELWLVANLLYGAGLRLMEALRLRVKDIDFEYRQITVPDGKGAKDRVSVLPEKIIEPLRMHLERVKRLHTEDLRLGFGAVYLPFVLERKYKKRQSGMDLAIHFSCRQAFARHAFQH